jgi:ABC-type transport system involved in multi-copper enzyme maturation permease subunit
MNPTLLKKEIRGLRFCTLLILVFYGIGWVDQLYNEFPDRYAEEAVNDGGSWLVYWLLVGLFIGITSFNQEREHETLGFLDGLAVSRTSIFLHKLAAALLVMVFATSLMWVQVLLLDGFSATSMSPAIPWSRYLAECGLGLLLGINITAVGMVLSFTRKWFPLIAGVLFLGLVLAATSARQWVTWIDSSALVTIKVGDDGAWIVPWKQLTGFSLLGTTMLLLACLLFRWRDGRISRWLEREFAVWQKVLIGAAVVAVWCAGFIFFAKSQKTEDHGDTVAEAAGAIPTQNPDARVVGFASHETEHYEVLFKESQRKEVTELDDGMDEIYQQVAGYFQNPSLPGGRIVLDVASSVDSHAAGVANWTKIRVPLSKSEDSLDFMQVLRHETAHVFIEQLSDGKATTYFNAMRAFHEGVATAVEVSPDDEETRTARLKMERWAALADSRGRVPLETLLDDEELRTRYDPALAYPLGYVFATALVEIGGPGLPRRVMETLRDSPPPPNPTSRQVWQHVLQECGTSLETVVAAYAAGLNRVSAQEASYVAGFPRLSAEVTVEGGEIVIRLNPYQEETQEAKPICLVERSMGLTEKNQAIRISPDGTFRLPRGELRGNRIRYLLGWDAEDMRYPVLEPWAEKTIP